MQSLVVGPVGRRDVGVDRRLRSVPVGDPQVVGLGERRAVLRHEVEDPRRVAGVHARQVAVGVQRRRPRAEVGQHRGRVGGGPVVGLHVVVDRVAGPDPDRLGAGDGVGGGGAALRGRLGRRDRRAAARVGGRLQADVDRDDVPAGRGLRADPAGGQVRLRAGHVGAADVDAGGAERRLQPVGHRRLRRGLAGVEPEAGEDAAGGARDRSGGHLRAIRGACALRRSRRERRWAIAAGGAVHGELAAGRSQRPDRQRPADQPRVTAPGGGDHDVIASMRRSAPPTGRRRRRPRSAAGWRWSRPPAAGRSGLRGHEDRLGAAERVGRAALGGRRGAEVDGVPVEPHARARAGRQPEHGPARRDLDRVAAVADRPGRRRPPAAIRPPTRRARAPPRSAAIGVGCPLRAKGDPSQTVVVAVCLRG